LRRERRLRDNPSPKISLSHYTRNLKFFNSFFPIIPIALPLPMHIRSPPKLPILTFYSTSIISYSRRNTQSAPSTGKMPDFENTSQIVHLFASFFSIFLLFFLFSPFSLSFCNFFFNFSSFLKCPPLILAQNQGCLKIPHTKSPAFLTQKSGCQKFRFAPYYRLQIHQNLKPSNYQIPNLKRFLFTSKSLVYNRLYYEASFRQKY